MTMTKQNFIKATTIILILFIIASPHAISKGYAGGVLPGVIKIESALKGEMCYKRSMRITNGGDNATNFILNSSEEISNWVSFYESEDSNLTNPINNITVPSKTKETIIAAFQIAKDTPNGIHEGMIYVDIGETNQTNVNTSDVIIRLPVKVFINVTGEQLLSGKIEDIKIANVETGKDLAIKVDFINTGNVIAQPIIQVNITRNKWPIDSFVYSNTKVETNQGEFINVKWNTKDREPGTYNASVTVSLGDTILTKKDLSFEILPRGTLTRKGELVNFSYEGKPELNNMIKILAEFRNTGSVEMSAKFVGEIYRDNKLIKTLQSEEVLVPQYSTFIFTDYITIENKGKHEVQGYILYETNRTAIKTLSFELEDSKILEDTTIFVFIFLAGIIGVASIYLIKKEKNKYIYKKIKKSKVIKNIRERLETYRK